MSRRGKNTTVYYRSTGEYVKYNYKKDARSAINNAVKNGEMTRKEGAQAKRDSGAGSGS